jgi:hypothetical protein
MAEKNPRFRQLIGFALGACTVLALTLPLHVSPANAQGFFFDRSPQGGFFGPWNPQIAPAPPPPVDYSRAPAPKKPETPPTTTIVVMGDAMADWLAYGLEDAFSDTPEIGILRKHRTVSGLIRYDSRNDQDWARVARDILAAEKPAAVVMMLGLNDRQTIRERPAARGANPPPGQTPEQPQPDAENPDVQIMAPEPSRGGGASGEFRSERWAELYAKRIEDTIAALKSKGVPVIWAGLPPVRGPKSMADTAYLNDLYRLAAEKHGIVYVDVWDGFVDEAGKFITAGPDVEGQTRRLRTPDGAYFTKAGARKLAHFVEREITRVMAIRTLPVALPVDDPASQPAALARPGGPAPRPLAGAIVPLTASPVSTSEELLGGSIARPVSTDPTAARALINGEPVAPSRGRADDFGWAARSGATAAAQSGEPAVSSPPAVVAQPVAAPVAQPAKGNEAAKPAKEAEAAKKPPAVPVRQTRPADERSPAAAAPPAQRRPQPATRDVPRPPAPVGQFGWFR